MTNINLLPWRVEKQQRKKKHIIVFVLLAVIAMSLFAMVIYYYSERQITRQSTHQKGIPRLVRARPNKVVKSNASPNAFSLDSLHFVGVLRQNTRVLALIIQPDGLVRSVRTGEYISQHRGMVLHINENSLDIKDGQKLITLHLRT